MKNTGAEVFKFIITAFFSFSFFVVTAQDSIPEGIINVKRPAIQAAFKISLVYFDPDSSKHRNRISEISFKQIVLNDSAESNPVDPQPYSDYRSYDAASFAKDSTRGPLTFSITSTPARQFNWKAYLRTIPWKYLWSDSTRKDSAKFEFTIDKNGKASLKTLPWKRNEDSTQLAFEKTGALYLSLLKQWYPAKRVKGKQSERREPRTKNVACKVIVTLYAYDPNEGRLLPIETNYIPPHK
jgi:hypothetical protein